MYHVDGKLQGFGGLDVFEVFSTQEYTRKAVLFDLRRFSVLKKIVKSIMRDCGKR